MPNRITRRSFLNRAGKGMAGALASACLTRPSRPQAGTAPNDRITLGFIGLGGQGNYHFRKFLDNSEAQILAVCDVFQEHREKARRRANEKYGNQNCASYNDFRELLDRDDIDAVVIATPDHWHTRIAVSACEAGKDIYCEKPLTLTIGEGKALVKAVRRYNRIFQVGSQQRSDWRFRFTCELVRSGRIGRVHTVKVFLPNGSAGGEAPDSDPPDGFDWNMYLGPAPWVPYNKDRTFWNFRWFFDYSGGQMTDWGAHHFDIAQWGLGTDLTGPISVEGTGTLPSEGLFETYTDFSVTLQYANGVTMIATNPEHGTRFEGADGWVHVWRGGMDSEPKDLMYEILGPKDVHLYESNDHHADWLNSIRARKRPICDVEVGHRSVSVAHLSNIALRLGRKLYWDPDREEFVDDPEANRWLVKPYRAPWYL
ncbi:MAG TPA: Gfo/Idh/MocA family oxidoreductase [bacterium]|nr:Gfo/Idh/MocA family oxidoreductase [bacterium]HQL62233.1 Gfo/Idh/MocA family oxidoreductase [bacterium]